MVEFNQKPRRKNCQDLSTLIEQLELNSDPPKKKPNTLSTSNLREHKPASSATEQNRLPESCPDRVADYMVQCKLPTKQGKLKDYVLKLQRGCLIMSRPKNTRRPLLVYPLQKF